jgi:hypothetical protein
MFKIEELALADTTEMQLKHPVTDEVLYADKEETQPVTFTLYGSSSKQYRKAVDALMRKAHQRGKREATPAERREDSRAFLVALSVKIDNMEYKGEPVNTPEAFDALYSDDSLGWILEQVNAAIGSVEGFLK